MVRCLVEKWGANLRAMKTYHEGVRGYYPLFVAACNTDHDVVAYFLDECGMDVNSATPGTKDTVLHCLISSRSDSKIEAVRMLKYLVEEKGASYSLPNAAGLCAWNMVLLCNNATFNYFLSVRDGAPKSVADLAPSDEWESPEEGEAAMKVYVNEELAKKKRAKEAATKALFDEQEAKANEAAAALLADLDAEDQREAAAAAMKKKTKKSNKKTKKAGGQQPVASTRSVGDRAPGLEESKVDDKKLAPQPPSQKEEEQQRQEEQVEGEGSTEQQQQQQQRQRRRRRGARPEEAVAAAMGDLSLKEGKDVGAVTREVGGEGGLREKNLEEEKQDFFDGAPDGLKCSVGFCLMTEAVLAMDEFSYQKSSLEGHIAHCAAKGLPLTSPLTGEPTGGMFMPNQNLRTLVKDYIAQREKEWGLYLAQRRAAAESAGEIAKKR